MISWRETNFVGSRYERSTARAIMGKATSCTHKDFIALLTVPNADLAVDFIKHFLNGPYMVRDSGFHRWRHSANAGWDRLTERARSGWPMLSVCKSVGLRLCFFLTPLVSVGP